MLNIIVFNTLRNLFRKAEKMQITRSWSMHLIGIHSNTMMGILAFQALTEKEKFRGTN